MEGCKPNLPNLELQQRKIWAKSMTRASRVTPYAMTQGLRDP